MKDDRVDDEVRADVTSDMEAYFEAEASGAPEEKAFAAARVAPEGPWNDTSTL